MSAKKGSVLDRSHRAGARAGRAMTPPRRCVKVRQAHPNDLDSMTFSDFSATVRRLVLLSAVLALAGAAAPALAAPKGTGLPLPRFVSVRAEELNLRTGPGVQHPVEWVYKRADLPLEIIAEFRNWRKVRDWQGTQGWVHQSMLGGRRTFIVTGAERVLRAKGNEGASAVARLEAGVVGAIDECPDASTWCRVTAGGYEGWLRRTDIWGVYGDEVVR